MAKNNAETVARRLAELGVSRDDAMALRRIALTLERWHELECGDANGHAIERDDNTGRPYLTGDLADSGRRWRVLVPDREAGALRRMRSIMARYPQLRAYVQSDPRGNPLYILPPGVSDDTYHQGVAVYR